MENVKFFWLIKVWRIVDIGFKIIVFRKKINVRFELNNFRDGKYNINDDIV